MRFRSALPILAALLAVAASPQAATAAATPHADHAEQAGSRVVAQSPQAMVITNFAVEAPALALRVAQAIDSVAADSLPQARALVASDSASVADSSATPIESTDPGAVAPPCTPDDPHSDFLLIAYMRDRLTERSRGGGASMSQGGPSLEGRHPLGDGGFRRLAPPAP